jgi:hypothetical protein
MAFGGVDEEAKRIVCHSTTFGGRLALEEAIQSSEWAGLSYDWDCLGIACVCTVRAQCTSKSRMTILRVAMMSQSKEPFQNNIH